MEQRNEIRMEIMKNKISATIFYKTHYSTKIVISGLTKKETDIKMVTQTRIIWKNRSQNKNNPNLSGIQNVLFNFRTIKFQTGNLITNCIAIGSLVYHSII